MKKIIFVLCLALLAAAACRKETPAPEAKEGIPMTISAAIEAPTRTNYEEVGNNINVTWEMEEYITVVSLGDAGITAVDEFTSSGEGGRDIANFTGTWNGNEGDKVICLYPAITTLPGLYSGVEVGSSEIQYNHYNDINLGNNDPSSLNYFDVMTGDVTIGTRSVTANVVFRRQIVVFKMNFPTLLAGLTHIGDTEQKLDTLTMSVLNPDDTPANTFVTGATLSATKSGYTGNFVPTAYGPVGFSIQIGYYKRSSILEGTVTEERSGPYYAPVLVNGNIPAGNKLKLVFGGKTYDYGGLVTATDPEMRVINYTLPSTLTLTKGKYYTISDEPSGGR